jgi:hypothetical protein
MIKFNILLFFAFIATFAKADFVDVATLSVNGKQIQKLTNNKGVHYLVNLNAHHVGDTLHLDIWTDYGGEDHAFFSIQNMDTQQIDTLSRSNNIVLTETILSTKHLITVTFLHKNYTSAWEICMITPDDRIEKVYQRMNAFIDCLNSTKFKSIACLSTFSKDTVACNFNLSHFNKDSLRRMKEPEKWLNPEVISTNLKFTKNERKAFESFDAANYMEQYTILWSTKVFFDTKIDETNFQWFSITIGDYNDQLLFYFTKVNEGYLLEKISYFNY